MSNFVGIRINNRHNLCYCETEKCLKLGTTIIVSQDKTLFFAKVVKENLKSVKNLPEYQFVRVSNKNDYKIFKENQVEEIKALKKCKNLVNKLKLKMNILSCEYTFNKNQLIFNFTADSRVDFRDLVKELAEIYKTRIELRQVGVRDKAKVVGGCGQCGKQLCCNQFLNDLDSVSINMAKNQGLALNPNKINGVCGRLLCCLKYEDDTYTACRRVLPCLGSMIETEDGKGRVVAVDLLKKSYKVDIPEKGIIECVVEDESSK